MKIGVSFCFRKLRVVNMLRNDSKIWVPVPQFTAMKSQEISLVT